MICHKPATIIVRARGMLKFKENPIIGLGVYEWSTFYEEHQMYIFVTLRDTTDGNSCMLVEVCHGHMGISCLKLSTSFTGCILIGKHKPSSFLDH